MIVGSVKYHNHVGQTHNHFPYYFCSAMPLALIADQLSLVMYAALTPLTGDYKNSQFKVRSKITKINVQVLVYLAMENAGLEIYNLQNQGNEDDSM